MNRNNYQLGSGSFELNEKADKLMEVICFLGNERVYAKRFPEYSTIKYCGIDETELIEAIEDLEKVYAKIGDDHHHKAHTHYLSYNKIDDYYRIYPNNTEYGTDLNTTNDTNETNTSSNSSSTSSEKVKIELLNGSGDSYGL